MSEGEELRARAVRLDHSGLVRLWERARDGSAADWPPGRAFEHLVLRAFQLAGATVEWPFKVYIGEATATDESKDVLEQIDGAIHHAGRVFLVECKDWDAASVDADAVVKLRSKLLRRPAGTVGIVFARGQFTRPARIVSRFLAPQLVLLWAGDEFDAALRGCFLLEGLDAKVRYASERGVPDYKCQARPEPEEP